MGSLEETIEEYHKVVEEKIRDVEVTKRKLDLLIELKKIKDKRLKGEKLTNDDIRQAQRITCFGLAHCCKYTKQCPWFLSCCDILGLEPKEVSEYKEKIMYEFLRKKYQISISKECEGGNG